MSFVTLFTLVCICHFWQMFNCFLAVSVFVFLLVSDKMRTEKKSNQIQCCCIWLILVIFFLFSYRIFICHLSYLTTLRFWRRINRVCVCGKSSYIQHLASNAFDKSIWLSYELVGKNEQQTLEMYKRIVHLLQTHNS